LFFSTEKIILTNSPDVIKLSPCKFYVPRGTDDVT